MHIAVSNFVCYVLKLMFEVVPLALKLVNFFFRVVWDFLIILLSLHLF